MPFLYYKNNAKRTQKRQACLGDYAEMQLIFYKNNANRAQKRQACLGDYAEMQLIFYKQIERRSAKLAWAIMPRCSLFSTKILSL